MRNGYRTHIHINQLDSMTMSQMHDFKLLNTHAYIRIQSQLALMYLHWLLKITSFYALLYELGVKYYITFMISTVYCDILFEFKIYVLLNMYTSSYICMHISQHTHISCTKSVSPHGLLQTTLKP